MRSRQYVLRSSPFFTAASASSTFTSYGTRKAIRSSFDCSFASGFRGGSSMSGRPSQRPELPDPAVDVLGQPLQARIGLRLAAEHHAHERRALVGVGRGPVLAAVEGPQDVLDTVDRGRVFN